MEYAKIHRLFWNAKAKDEMRRERNLEKRIHTDLVWKEIEPFIAPGISVLDAGGGFGRYAVPLAERGCRVVLLDLSPAMIKRAKEWALREGVSSAMEFVVGKVEDLSAFSHREFDLVLSLDAPVSYAYPEEGKALRELARVTRKTLIFSVVNRLGQLPVAVHMELKWRKKLLLARKFWQEGNWDHPSLWESIEEKIPFLARFLFPPLHAFTPQEIADLVIANGLRLKRMAATGTLARLLPPRTLRKIVRDPELYREFVHLSLLYDAQIEVLGVGCKVASGLLVVAEKEDAHGVEMV